MTLVANKVVIPQYLEYLIVDCELTIIEFSAGISRFIDFSEEIYRGKDLRTFFPELFGHEEILTSILAGKQESYSFPKINRYSSSEFIYFNLYIQQYYLEQSHQKYLIIFLEDIAKNILLEEVFSNHEHQYSLVHESSLFWNQLVKSHYFYEQIISSIADALIVTNSSGIIKNVNQTTIDLLGYSDTELIDQSINKIIAERNFPLDEIQQYLFDQGKWLKNIELICRTKQNSLITISFSCSLLKTINNYGNEFIYLGRDITKIRSYQLRQRLQYRISQIIANSTSLADTTSLLLSTICEHLGWAVGEIWLPQRNEVILKCQGFWSNASIISPNFAKITQELNLQVGEGIAGNTWLNNSFSWLKNLSLNCELERQKLIQEARLMTGCSLPLQSEGDLLGVINFFSQQEQEIDRNLQKIMEAIANQIAQFIQRKKTESALLEQQQDTEKLLLNILPELITKKLKQQQSTIADRHEAVTILFADLVNFTDLFTQTSPIEVVEILNEIFSEFDRLCDRYNLEKIKTIGDAYMVVGGIPQPRQDHAEAIAEMALAMQQAIAEFNNETDKTLSLRIGINTGSVIAGIIGTKKFTYDLWGDAVNIARRMESQGIRDRIQVTASTYELLRHKYHFQERGSIYIKGKGEMTTYLLMGKK
jgi:PAS domain S-box-containing protein